MRRANAARIDKFIQPHEGIVLVGRSCVACDGSGWTCVTCAKSGAECRCSVEQQDAFDCQSCQGSGIDDSQVEV